MRIEPNSAPSSTRMPEAARVQARPAAEPPAVASNSPSPAGPRTAPPSTQAGQPAPTAAQAGMLGLSQAMDQVVSSLDTLSATTSAVPAATVAGTATAADEAPASSAPTAAPEEPSADHGQGGGGGMSGNCDMGGM